MCIVCYTIQPTPSSWNGVYYGGDRRMASGGLIRAGAQWRGRVQGMVRCSVTAHPFNPMMEGLSPTLYHHCTIPPTRSCTKVKLVVAELPHSILLHFYVIHDVRLVSLESLFICPFARPAIRIQCMGRLCRGGLL